MESRVWTALAFTLFAGLSTGIGSVVAFTARRTNYRFLSVATGFSAGAMIWISFMELLPEGAASLAARYGDRWGPWVNAAAFFGGVLLIGVIDRLIPETENPHEPHSPAETEPLRNSEAPLPDFQAISEARPEDLPAGAHDHRLHHRSLMRMGLFTALAITIHNFPEGLATFLGTLQDTSIGAAIAVAVALHNIPEGISVSVPIFYATGSRRRAFIYSLLSGLAEPVGAGVAYLLLRLLLPGNTFPGEVMGLMFGGVAGIMVYISADELLPTSRAYGRGHDSITGLVAGMAMMALSLLLMS